MISHDLSSGWRFRRLESGEPYPRPQTQQFDWMTAHVPGHVHLDLVVNRMIADPFKECFEAGLGWVDESDWEYETEFDWKPAGPPRKLLRFEGLDTIAEIFLNDERVGSSDNFFLPLEIDVSESLISGLNRLQVIFRSAVRAGEERRRDYFAANRIAWQTQCFDERAFIRKPGYMFGWDWGPRLVSCGIYAPVRLLEFEDRIVHSSIHQRHLGGDRFALRVEAEIEGNTPLRVRFDGTEVPDEFEVSGERWWPNGEGTQVLHDVELSLGSGQVVHKRIGLRTIEFIRESDAIGQSFEFAVNGQRIWSRGANWIPPDSFPSRIAGSEVQASIRRYAGLNMNMLRVWGGGLYESEAFYDACDEHGILVWQDFPYACSYYPDGPEEQSVASIEAEHHVLRLRDRTSLAIWCGNNENHTMWHGKWGGKEASPSRFYGENLFDSVLKEVVNRLDPERFYIESSPLQVAGSTPESRDDHYWDVWHGRGDWVHFADSKARFSSEFGFASSCSMQAWKSVSDRPLELEDPAVRWHDKTDKGWEKFYGYVELHYPKSKTLEDWVYYSQLNQRDALRFAIEHYRASEGCRGALIWQANDCWPVQSWSIEDSSRLLKPAGFELRRLYAGVLLAIVGKDVVVVNDGAEPIYGLLYLRTFELVSTRLIEESNVQIEVTPGKRIGFPLPTIPASCVLQVALEQHPEAERWVNFDEPKNLNLEAQTLDVMVIDERLTVSITGYVQDLVIWAVGDGYDLVDGHSGDTGIRAFTGIDLRLSYGLAQELPGRKTRSLRARSIAGEHFFQ